MRQRALKRQQSPILSRIIRWIRTEFWLIVFGSAVGILITLGVIKLAEMLAEIGRH